MLNICPSKNFVGPPSYLFLFLMSFKTYREFDRFCTLFNIFIFLYFIFLFYKKIIFQHCVFIVITEDGY